MKQITILARTGSDIIAEVTELFAAADVNIECLTGEHYGTQAIINVTVDNERAALCALRKKLDWQIVSEDAILVWAKDEVGALARLSRRLADAEVMIRSIRFIERNNGRALIAISTHDPDAGKALLKDMLAI